MSDLDDFWHQVILHIGNQYHPHTGASGLARFKDKLKRERYDEDLAIKHSPELIARAVPWAAFLTLGGKNFLRLAQYRPVTNSLCPLVAFDSKFELHVCLPPLGDWEVAGGRPGLLTWISLERFQALESGQIDLLEAFMNPEKGLVHVITAEKVERIMESRFLDREQLPKCGETSKPLTAPLPRSKKFEIRMSAFGLIVLGLALSFFRGADHILPFPFMLGLSVGVFFTGVALLLYFRPK